MSLLQPNKVTALAKGCAHNLMLDLKDKFTNLVKKSGMSVKQFAETYDISMEDVNFINKGISMVSVRTYLKILILSGHTIEVKSLRETLQPGAAPMPPMPPMPPRPGFSPRFPGMEGQYRHAPEPGEPMRAQTRPTRPKPSVENEWNEFDVDEEEQDEFDDMYGDEMPPIDFNEPATEPQAPNFRAMGRQQLTAIIEDKLWSSEIDIENASTRELVEFLEKKDELHKQNVERRQRRQEREEADLESLKDRLADAIKANPHLKGTVESLLNRN